MHHYFFVFVTISFKIKMIQNFAYRYKRSSVDCFNIWNATEFNLYFYLFKQKKDKETNSGIKHDYMVFNARMRILPE